MSAGRVMRVVVDTNVLVSALMGRGSVPGQVLDLAIQGELTMLYDPNTLAEYRAVLGRPQFRGRFSELNVSLLLRFVEVHGEQIPNASFAGAMPDPDDRAFAAVAFTGAADLLITGNVKDFPTGKSVRVVTPSEFLELWARVGQLNSMGLDPRAALDPNEPFEVALACKRCLKVEPHTVLGLGPIAEPRQESFTCRQPDATQPDGMCGGELWTYDDNDFGRRRAKALGVPTKP